MEDIYLLASFQKVLDMTVLLRSVMESCRWNLLARVFKKKKRQLH